LVRGIDALPCRGIPRNIIYYMTTSFVRNTVIESGQRYAPLESIELLALGFEVGAPILEGQ
jgi:hypothetical protein